MPGATAMTNTPEMTREKQQNGEPRGENPTVPPAITQTGPTILSGQHITHPASSGEKGTGEAIAPQQREPRFQNLASQDMGASEKQPTPPTGLVASSTTSPGPSESNNNTADENASIVTLPGSKAQSVGGSKAASIGGQSSLHAPSSVNNGPSSLHASSSRPDAARADSSRVDMPGGYID